MNSRLLSEKIKAEALRLGFFACGIARAEPVDDAYRAWMLQRVERREYADMDYMYRNLDKRLDPTKLMPGVKSIICVALNYAPATRMPEDSYQLADYALGLDYHDVMKRKLRELALAFGWREISINHAYQNESADSHLAPSLPTEGKQDTTPSFRVFCDTAPVAERYWAQRAGIGWIGKHSQIIIPHAGSQFFLGEIFVDLPLAYDTPMTNRCGTCQRCIDACPTKAIRFRHDDAKGIYPTTMDAARCLSYQTIENRGELSAEAKEAMGKNIYGCDICLKACPWNRFAQPNSTPEFVPKPDLLAMTIEKWQQLSEDEYRLLFKGSAVKRVKYAGLMRNIKSRESD